MGEDTRWAAWCNLRVREPTRLRARLASSAPRVGFGRIQPHFVSHLFLCVVVKLPNLEKRCYLHLFARIINRYPVLLVKTLSTLKKLIPLLLLFVVLSTKTRSIISVVHSANYSQIYIKGLKTGETNTK